jgi:diguanylate cyclase (GGDEF)-like protein/PAS domain S-box-containing protein
VVYRQGPGGKTAMGLKFTLKESSALYGLLAEGTSDIILKTDREGFIVHASSAIERLGLLSQGMLIGPHLLDLVHPSRASVIKAEHDAAINGNHSGRWVEFPARVSGRRERWFEIQMRSLANDAGEVYGALAVMRSIEERRAFEDKLFNAAMTDPLTGLTNRPAFITMLQHLIEQEVGGCLALFDIDHFKAINMKYGQSVGDEVLVVFSDFLRTLTRSSDIISRVSGESLGILLPRAAPDLAEEICQRIIATLSEIRRSAGTDALTITVSGGVARIGESVDSTIRRAEMALFFAKTKGRNRLEMEKG